VQPGNLPFNADRCRRFIQLGLTLAQLPAARMQPVNDNLRAAFHQLVFEVVVNRGPLLRRRTESAAVRIAK
jgi:hypothetical protein